MKKILVVSEEDLLNSKWSLNKCSFELLPENECPSTYLPIRPYVFFLDPSNGKFLMWRKVYPWDNSLLDPTHSLGFGSTINNATATAENIYKVLADSVAQELKECINYQCDEDELYDIQCSLEHDNYIIQQTQLGIAMIFLADPKKISALIEKDQTMDSPMWLCPKSIRSQGLKLENWAQLALDYFVPSSEENIGRESLWVRDDGYVAICYPNS